MRPITFIILVLLSSCDLLQTNKTNAPNADSTRASINSNSNVKTRDEDLDGEVLETFADSTNIGKKKRSKVEMIRFRLKNDYFVVIKFFFLGMPNDNDGLEWVKANIYCFETDGISELDPKISDFNNDGFNDLTFVSGTAARGANEIRQLLIFDNKVEELISIVNSPEYPNMQYNKELDCIDAFIVYGGCSTVFLKIEGEKLREIASVSLFNGLTVSTYDENGNERIIKRDNSITLTDIRYKNYRPLKAYETHE